MARTARPKHRLDALAGQPDPRAPLDAAALLAAARPVLARLEADLRARAAASPAVSRALEERHAAERAAQRTADGLAAWTDALATQVAAAWLLSCVFVRTLEDRGLSRHARLAGPGALDSQRLFLQLAPSLNERDYLLTVFRELAGHPAARDLFDAEHSLVWKLSPSAGMAKELLALFRTPSADAPAFRFGQASTRFLGDLYQDLSEDVRKRYALLQTPDFVEAFILDRTLEPALARFGLDDTTVIDPTCGSGHFLLGAFDRLFERRLLAEPGVDRRVAATKALAAVYGADINPYAVAIARFRLTLAYLDKAGYARLADAPTLPLKLVVADSLLHNPQRAQGELGQVDGQSAGVWGGKLFAVEDEAAAREVLGRQYAAVVGNPPYITEKDPAKREVYRRMYASAAGKYALSAPFCERFFQLARERGYVGQITANSFMKREFGKKLIEDYLPTVNLELIVNTSGAYIPGHGTPTVLLFGTHEPAVERDVLAVLAKRGEPSTPADPAKGLVWSSVVSHWSEVGFEDDYLSVARVGRDGLGKHPWSLGGGGASELKELLEERCEKRLGEVAESIGIASFTLEDDVFLRPRSSWLRSGSPEHRLRPMVIGEAIRDWTIGDVDAAFFPYESDFSVMSPDSRELSLLWPWRSVLSNNKLFGGKTKVEGGLAWYEYGRLTGDKLRTPLTIAFAFVATHNHFVLDRGGKVFNRSAPIIKLPASATEDDHLALLAYLNSSTACFWMKQVFHDKGGGTDSGKWQSEKAKVAYEFTGTGLESLPVPRLEPAGRAWLIGASREMHDLARRRNDLVDKLVSDESAWSALPAAIPAAAIEDGHLLARLVALQEDTDWVIYGAYSLSDDTSKLSAAGDGVPLGQRPFEVTLARRGQHKTIDGVELDPNAHDALPTGIRAIIEARASAIAESTDLQLVEDPHYKRRWLTTPKDLAGRVQRFEDVVRDRLVPAVLDRCERALAGDQPMTAKEIVEAVGPRGLHAVAWLQPAVEPATALRTLIATAAVPFAAAHRFSDSGLTKFALWTDTWDAQRAEDAGEVVNPGIPPKYKDDDYRTEAIAELRGKLDVPKERFISYPGCESDEDGEPLYGWAGWNHLQRAQALSSLYIRRRDADGWPRDRLTPMLAGLLELIPWLQQWHNEPSADFDGLRMGDYFQQFLSDELRKHSLTPADLRAWRPAKNTTRKPRPLKPASSDPAKPRKPRAKRAQPVESEEAE